MWFLGPEYFGRFVKEPSTCKVCFHYTVIWLVLFGEIMPISGEPLSKKDAQALMRKIAQTGNFVQTNHFKERLLERGFDILDVINALKYGLIDETKTIEKDGTWRYRAYTNKINIGIAFRNENKLVLITVF